MISREELLHRIKDAMWVEERAFPIHRRHIEQSMRWYGFSPEEEREVRAVLAKMAEETQGHAAVLQSIYDEVMDADRPTY